MSLPETASHLPAINFPELLERVENDRELLHDLLDMFRDEYPRQRQLLEAAVVAKDMQGVNSTGHTLKGILANLAMSRGAQAASRIEQAGKENNLEELQLALSTLDQEAITIFSELDTNRTDASA